MCRSALELVNSKYITAAKQPHGFFNHTPWTQETTLAADAWLVANGYLTGAGSLKPSLDARLTKQ